MALGRNRGFTGGAVTGLGGIAEVGASALGAEAALAPLLGVAALPLLGYGIAQLLIGALSGRPKMLDTVQAVARLAQSRDPAIKQLARNLAIWTKNGVPLSTGNPQQRAQLMDWIGGTIQTITARNPRASASAVGTLDKAINNVLQSQVANPASRLDATISQLGLGQVGGAATPLAVVRGGKGPLGRTPRRIPATQAGAQPPSGYAQPLSVPQRQPAPPQGGIVDYLENLSLQHPYLHLAGCIAIAAQPELEPLALRCLESLILAQATDAGKKILRAARDYVSSILGGQRTAQPFQLPPPSQPAPLLRQDGTCTTCGTRGKLSQQLRAQQSQLQREIETETEQGIEEQLGRQESELSDLAQLEQQPASQRNIPQELQRKQQLQRQIAQEQAQLDQGQPQPQPIQRAQPGQPAPRLQENEAAKQIERQIADLEKSKQVPIQFCVGCQSNEDAILFLNGEPSACSVIPGMTKELPSG